MRSVLVLQHDPSMMLGKLQGEKVTCMAWEKKEEIIEQVLILEQVMAQ